MIHLNDGCAITGFDGDCRERTMTEIEGFTGFFFTGFFWPEKKRVVPKYNKVSKTEARFTMSMVSAKKKSWKRR